jgi:UDP-N-acetylglucosamine--N-acetylmuramyl-(pentapeptide) pyrophosphoryl-undecaprenol N-acetylglucosamine transferase
VRVFFTGGGTGGHLYPALAIARALVRVRSDVRPFFIGAVRGIERTVLPTTEFPHVLLDLHPLYRSAPWRNWRTAAGVLNGWRQVARLARVDPPALAVATGGYASGATLAFATFTRLPFVIQEQNSFPGQTVRLFARWAREVYLGFPEAAQDLHSRARARAIDTGNPIEPPPADALRRSRADARRDWGLSDNVTFVVLAFGGSQGSAALNGLIDSWLSQGLPEGVGLIWATGPAHFPKHSERAGARVIVRPYLAPISAAYEAADVAVTRAGAMTTAELCAWGIPMFLVPLPTAAADHQTANARALEAAGAAEWIEEKDADGTRIGEFVRQLSGDRDLYERRRRATVARARPDAARQIAARLEAMLPSPGGGVTAR